jgi:hypothetical protein
MSFENRYTLSDRVVHRLAFSSRGLQLSLADLEDRLYRRELAGIQIDRPVFISGLPRAGTTILLDVLAASGAFASHTYRDAPFVLCPMLWHGISSRFQVSQAARERAHGDGMLVSVDSPEAFEEMIWMAFWKDHYLPDRIQPWTSYRAPAFAEFLEGAMRKVIALRQRDGGTAGRYISKNNLNIARLKYLGRLFPDATILVPFREPVQHAASLLVQHRRFLDMHRAEPFVRDYMAGIGHFDFGETLRPVNFVGWLDQEPPAEPTSLEFWLRYWVAAHGFMAEQFSEQVRPVCYEKLTDRPVQSLSVIASVLGAGGVEALVGQGARLHPPRPHAVPDDLNAHLLERAQALYRELCGRSLI